MKEEKITLKDSTILFVKDFSLSKSPTIINKYTYWRVSSSDNSVFQINGYLRLNNEKIWLLPLGSDQSNFEQENVLLDFSDTAKSSWVCIFSKEKFSFGDSIISKGRNTDGNDTLYKFRFYPFKYYKKNETKDYESYFFDISVSKKKGIKDIITTTDEFILFEAYLYPIPRFINRVGGKLLL
jgi:hypothetical protein